MIHQIAQYLVDTIGSFGYLGIFALMFLESTFFPFPSEIIMIPAGYLAYQGEMNLFVVVAIGVLGSIAGAVFNYYFAIFFGRKFLLRYGKYILVSPQTLQKLEEFFKSHGEISTFSGRLIPGIRQLISLPAGLARMNMARFIIYSTIGAAIWVVVLVAIGYFIGSNQELVSQYLQSATTIALISIAVIVGVYIYKHKKSR
jgi:membrane protein DedA with SNARE-associated domain